MATLRKNLSSGALRGLYTEAGLGRLSSLAVAAWTCLLVLLLSCKPIVVDAVYPWEVTSWTPSHATFYGSLGGQETMGGACAYGNLWWRGYGLNTAALSDTLFNNGLTCGACFELKCDFNGGFSTKWCYPNAGSVKVTATNHCPPNWAKPTNNGGWCNPPRTHFDLPQVMFMHLAQTVAGIIPVQYRRVPCVKSGGIKFYLDGNPYFNLILIYNVAGPGDVSKVQMRGDASPWYSMTRNWGQNWELKQKLTGQKLSFIVTVSNGEARVIQNLTPAQWYLKQTFQASTNF